MTGHRPLRLVLFFMELPRLALILSAVAGTGSAADLSPVAAFAAPQALFPLLAFFSWYDPFRYGSYLPLYAAGKAVSVAALSVWLWGVAPSVVSGAAALNVDSWKLLSAAAVACLFDAAACAIAGTSVYRAAAKERRASARTAADELPALVVDELPDDSGAE